MSTSRLGAAPKPASADDEGFKRELVLLIPHLRAFARTLTGDPTAADDLAAHGIAVVLLADAPGDETTALARAGLESTPGLDQLAQTAAELD